MTEEQNKLAERRASARLIELAISGIGPGFYKEIAFKPHEWREIIDALRREPATEAVRDEVLEEAAKACEQIERELHWSTKWCVQAIRALKGKGASQDGMVMVPREPTAAMVDAGMDQLAEDFSVSGDEGLCKVYRAMLAASPNEQKG